ncbi:MAG: tetratricopeptide repeat protein [Desulfobacterales bacterium]
MTNLLRRTSIAGIAFPAIAAFAFLVTGCTTTGSTAGLYPSPESTRVPPAENSFYYFTESQLQIHKGDLDSALQFLRLAVALDPDSMYLKRELAQLYWQRKEPEAAQAVVADLMATGPDNVENLIVFARIKHAMNQLEEAKSAYSRILEVDPDQKNIYLLLGEMHIDEGDPDAALQVYRRLTARFPDFLIGHYLMGHAHFINGDLIKAEKKYKHVLGMDPGFDEVRYDLIDVYRTPESRTVRVQSGDTFESLCRSMYGTCDEETKQAVIAFNPDIEDIDELQAGRIIRFPEIIGSNADIQNYTLIVGLYQEILEHHPEDIRAAMELGLYYHDMGKTADAENLLAQLGERSRHDGHVIRHVIELYIDDKRYDAALTVLKYMLKGAPGSSDIHYIMGLAYDGKNDPISAIRHFRHIAPESAFYKNSVLHTVYLYQNTENTEGALEFLEEVVQRRPREAEFYLYLGAIYEELKHYEKAHAVLQKGISIAPGNGRLFFRMGVIYDKWGKKEDSIRMMKEVIRLDPEDANALNYLGYTYAEMGENLDHAEELIKAALQLKPDDGYIMDSLGWVYYQKGIYKQALTVLEKAVTIVPDDPTILEHLGDAYLKNNNRRKALENYQKSMTYTDEGNDRLAKKIRELKKAGF